MSSQLVDIRRQVWPPMMILAAIIWSSVGVAAQEYDFKQLEQKVRSFSVIIDMKLEVSFGVHSTEQSERHLGTVVDDSGTVIFDGNSLAGNAGLPGLPGYAVKTTPVQIEVSTFEGRTYKADYLGVDRFTRLGFIRIQTEGDTLEAVRFASGWQPDVGDWLALYMLLPEFIDPPLAADIGMITTLVDSPERFPLTVGFNMLQISSVLFNEDLEPVGLLGALMDPALAATDAGGFLESFGQYGIPLLGIIPAERLDKLVADPPIQGEADRGWLGITLQALTQDLAEFWGLDLPGGIIVNDIVKNSPAQQAGLIIGDIIFEVNGQPIDVDKEEELSVFQRLVAEFGPGATVELAVVRREGSRADTMNLVAVLEEAPLAAIDAPEYENADLEFKVRSLVFADYMVNNLDPEEFSGVVVSELKLGGLADIGGLRIGDIIQKIDGQVVTSVDEADTALTEIAASRPDEVIFFVWRANQTLFVNVKTDWEQ